MDVENHGLGPGKRLKDMEKPAELNYETAYAALQDILRSLQDDTVGVDELSAKVTEAAELIRFCRERLRQAENALERLAEEQP